MDNCNCFTTKISELVSRPKDWHIFKLYISVYALSSVCLTICDCLHSAILMKFISSTDSGNI